MKDIDDHKLPMPEITQTLPSLQARIQQCWFSIGTSVTAVKYRVSVYSDCVAILIISLTCSATGQYKEYNIYSS